MRTLHVGLRVADLDRSLAFYTALGYEVAGSAPDTPLGHLTMLQLPGDEFVTLELVHDPAGAETVGSGLSHLVVQVESMDVIVEQLRARGIETESPTSPDEGFWLAWVTDPDGNRIELVQWPPGHAAGMSAADFAE
jgi:lactoylglutathione lyase